MNRTIGWMKGARALASGMLVLAGICVLPAASAAQDPGTPTGTTTTTTTAPAVPPVDPGTGAADQGSKRPGSEKGSPPPQTLTETPNPPVSTPVTTPSGKARASASTSVNMGDFFFSPPTISIHVGDTVTWRNSGQAPHTATADDGSFDTGTINSGGSGSHTFNSAGSFSYICTIHPNMHGTVRVLSA